MNQISSLEKILKAIQGNNGLMYTKVEVEELNKLIENAKHFYPPTNTAEKEVTNFCLKVAKLQKLILEYEASVDKIIIFDLELTIPEIKKLKVQFEKIQDFDLQINEIYEDLHYRYS